MEARDALSFESRLVEVPCWSPMESFNCVSIWTAWAGVKTWSWALPELGP
ncbi:MAG: hypothetical protein JRN25_04875 [Nitrososphaerota archaeon]|nr:hypothetical protein [Nitrososphaerota archaeon]